MCTVHDGISELARLSRLRKSQIKGLLVPPARAPASSTVRPCACACKLGLEGIVSKRLDSPYRSGRSQDWGKSKNPAAPAVLSGPQGLRLAFAPFRTLPSGSSVCQCAPLRL